MLESRARSNIYDIYTFEAIGGQKESVLQVPVTTPGQSLDGNYFQDIVPLTEILGFIERPESLTFRGSIIQSEHLHSFKGVRVGILP